MLSLPGWGDTAAAGWVLPVLLVLPKLLPCTGRGSGHSEGRDITIPSGPRSQMFLGEEGGCWTKVLL